ENEVDPRTVVRQRQVHGLEIHRQVVDPAKGVDMRIDGVPGAGDRRIDVEHAFAERSEVAGVDFLTVRPVCPLKEYSAAAVPMSLKRKSAPSPTTSAITMLLAKAFRSDRRMS